MHTITCVMSLGSHSELVLYSLDVSLVFNVTVFGGGFMFASAFSVIGFKNASS